MNTVSHNSTEPAGYNGFTLIELLVVVVIISILATIAMTQYGRAREDAFQVTLRNDLKVLATHQELYHGEHTYYAELISLPEFKPSFGVEIEVNHISPSGWSATAHHQTRPTAICGLFIGTVPADATGPATIEGEIGCVN